MILTFYVLPMAAVYYTIVCSVPRGRLQTTLEIVSLLKKRCIYEQNEKIKIHTHVFTGFGENKYRSLIN